jgi:hypothetical protein
MTICIAAICDGNSSAILASDSMLTNQGLLIQFEHPTKKMTRLSETCIALTAGDALAYTELFGMVEIQIKELREPSVFQIVDRVKGCYQLIREVEIKERILRPRGFADFREFYQAQSVLHPDIALTIQSQIERYDYGLEILIAGISEDKAHIYGISDPGTSKCFDAIGFDAIGTGLPHAINTLIARGYYQEMSLQEGLIIVYEAKKMAEKAPGVGSNITDICIMNSQGVTEFPREKIGELDKIYEKWVRKEPEWESDLDELLKEIRGPKK